MPIHVGRRASGSRRPLQQRAESDRPRRRARDHLRILAATPDLPDHRVDDVLAEVWSAGAARRQSTASRCGCVSGSDSPAALLGDPDVLVLDEPTNGLDPEGLRCLRDYLRGFAASGRTVLVSSRLLAEVAQTVDEVVVLRPAGWSPTPAVGLLRDRMVVRVRTPDPTALRATLDARGNPIWHRRAGARPRCTSETVERAIAATRVDHEISQEHTDLELAFLNLTTTTTGAPP